MNEGTFYLDNQSHTESWYGGKATCQLCGYEWAAVWPEKARDKALECPSCHELAGWAEPEPPMEHISI